MICTPIVNVILKLGAEFFAQFVSFELHLPEVTVSVLNDPVYYCPLGNDYFTFYCLSPVPEYLSRCLVLSIK